MASELSGRRVAVLATDGVEESELTEPTQALRDAGAQVDLVSLEDGEVQAVEDEIEKRGTYPVDVVVADADASDYDGLVLPGGVVNPDALRADEDAVAFVKAFVDAGKPVAAICHGPWTLVEAGAVQGRRLTSYPSIRTDLVNAGGEWVDEEVVVDGAVITSRSPDDLPAFCAATVEAVADVHAQAS